MQAMNCTLNSQWWQRLSISRDEVSPVSLYMSGLPNSSVGAIVFYSLTPQTIKQRHPPSGKNESTIQAAQWVICSWMTWCFACLGPLNTVVRAPAENTLNSELIMRNKNTNFWMQSCQNVALLSSSIQVFTFACNICKILYLLVLIAVMPSRHALHKCILATCVKLCWSCEDMFKAVHTCWDCSDRYRASCMATNTWHTSFISVLCSNIQMYERNACQHLFHKQCNMNKAYSENNLLSQCWFYLLIEALLETWLNINKCVSAREKKRDWKREREREGERKVKEKGMRGREEERARERERDNKEQGEGEEKEGEKNKRERISEQ